MSNKIKSLLESIDSLTVSEIGILKQSLSDKFGVRLIRSTIGTTMISEQNSAIEEQSEFEIVLVDGGSNKINVIKALRELFAMTLKEAKDFVDSCPKILKEAASKEEMENIKKKITEAGGKVSVE